jgi:hypothetical protein
MKTLSKSLMAGAAGLVLAGGAWAGEPVRPAISESVRLTADQLDEVTGGLRIRARLQLSWAAATSDAAAMGGSSASISTSNSASTSDTLNSNETTSSAGSTTSISTTSTRTASSSTSANASGTGSTAAGGGYSSAGDLLIRLRVVAP